MALFCSKIENFNAFLMIRCVLVQKIQKSMSLVILQLCSLLLTSWDILLDCFLLLLLIYVMLYFYPKCYCTLYSFVINYFQLTQCGHLGSEFFCTICIISIGALYSIMCVYRNFSDHYSFMEHPGFLSLF